MSEPDESTTDATLEIMGPPAGFQAGDGHATRRPGRTGAGRLPMTVTEKVMLWSKLGFPAVELAWLSYEELSVRLAAGWPHWANKPKQLTLDDVIYHMTSGRQEFVAFAGRRRGLDQSHNAEAREAEAELVRNWADILARAGWMPIGDRSALAVRFAIERALIDCDQVRKLIVSAGTFEVENGVLKIFN